MSNKEEEITKPVLHYNDLNIQSRENAYKHWIRKVYSNPEELRTIFEAMCDAYEVRFDEWGNCIGSLKSYPETKLF